MTRVPNKIWGFSSEASQGIGSLRQAFVLAVQFVNVSADRRWVLCVVCPCLQKATAKGITFVRVVVKGLGPGRQVSKRVKFVVFYPVLGYKLVIFISSIFLL